MKTNEDSQWDYCDEIPLIYFRAVYPLHIFRDKCGEVVYLSQVPLCKQAHESPACLPATHASQTRQINNCSAVGR